MTAASTHDVAVIGGGIVGLATALACLQRRPGSSVVVLDKETHVAGHQTGNNSGVIHSGIYYKPGSLKAKFCIEGNAEMVAFAQQHDIPYDICGKVIVAVTEASDLDRPWTRIYERGVGTTASAAAQIGQGPPGIELEPHVRRHRGPSTIPEALASSTMCQVCERLCREGPRHGGRRDPSSAPRVTGRAARDADGVHRPHVTAGRPHAPRSVSQLCGAAQSDRVATADRRAARAAKIVPFRGEYYALKPSAAAPGLPQGSHLPGPRSLRSRSSACTSRG